MSLFDYLFDNDWSQRSDIESLKQRNDALRLRLNRRGSELSAQSDRIDELESEVGQLALVNKTLMRMLVLKGVCSREEIDELMRAIDLEDSAADG